MDERLRHHISAPQIRAASADRSHPAGTGTGAAVPVSVWLIGGRQTSAAGTISEHLASRLIATYSRAGDTVVDLTDDTALRAACAAGARWHHAGWYIDVVGVVLGPASPVPAAAGAAPSRDDGEQEGAEPSALAAWFGDDLTDTDRSSHEGAAAVLSPSTITDGGAAFVVAWWSRTGKDLRTAAAMLADCAGLVRADGCLLVGVPQRTPSSELSAVVRLAASAGLIHVQHIVAVDRDDDGDRFVYYADEELLALARAGGSDVSAGRRHSTDLLIFSVRGPARPDRAIAS